MRFQEKIYIQNNNGSLRNRNNVNFNMSSDMCIFKTPLFNLSGASKIDCTGTTSGTSYIISTATTIPVTFDFTANTSSFSATNASFKYEIYKYSQAATSFIYPAIYQSSVIQYSSFSGTNTIFQDIQVSGLSLDGEYIVKGFYEFGVCTNFLNRLGKVIDTRINITGSEYGIYDNNLDYYFAAINASDKPIFLNNTSNVPSKGTLIQQVLLPETIAKQTLDGVSLTQNNMFTIDANYSGNFIVTLNGLALANIEDYTFSGTLVTLNSDIEKDDIITVIYTTSGGVGLVSDIISIDTEIPSGPINSEGANKFYLNTTTNKYEVYTTIEPNAGDTIIVMINGVSLAIGIDFYQSTSNTKRLILEGNLVIGDLVTLAYFPVTSVVNGIKVPNPMVNWQIKTVPVDTNGLFTLEMGTDVNLNNITYTATTPYQINKIAYNAFLTVTGTSGTQLYYRVKNEKNYTTICGDIISSIAYSDVIPITITTNAINTY